MASNDEEGMMSAELIEETQLLQAPREDDWKPPRGFVWIELAIFADVFSMNWTVRSQLLHPP
ncbi:hypothetical protein LTR37_001226 [Vermiconidia calcicola]|uniref:Uncharacterized protein n=1 Tax=Vermiconidia calcicola TaxID=1690605 RepID=A0ACC3NXU3_9PEZI|nr:hypothetical protein LTR37_001226 [Vermiconidia calcicola]